MADATDVIEIRMRLPAPSRRKLHLMATARGVSETEIVVALLDAADRQQFGGRLGQVLETANSPAPK